METKAVVTLSLFGGLPGVAFAGVGVLLMLRQQLIVGVLLLLAGILIFALCVALLLAWVDINELTDVINFGP